MYEAPVLQKQIDALKGQGLLEYNTGPWGATAILASKTRQEQVHFKDYIWCMEINYLKLNQVTKPFHHPIRRCDDAVQGLGDDRFLLSMDLDSGFYQVCVSEGSRIKLSCYGPDGRTCRYTGIHFGPVNAPPVFIFMMEDLSQEWSIMSKSLQVVQPLGTYVVMAEDCVLMQEAQFGTTVIVEDVLLFANNIHALMLLWCCSLIVFLHHRASIKLKKCRIMPTDLEIVGVSLSHAGNRPATSKSPT
jgi:hypothetical protein